MSSSSDRPTWSLAGSSSTVVVATALQRAAAGLAVVVVIRTYSVGVAGVLGALQFVGLAGAALAMLGSDSGLVRFVPALRMRSERDEEAALVRSVVVRTSVAAIAMACAVGAAVPLWTELFVPVPGETTRWLVIGTAVAIPLMVLAGMIAALLRAHERFTAFALVDRAVGSVATLAVIGVLALADADAPWLAVAVVAGPVVALGAGVIAVLVRRPVRPPGAPVDAALLSAFWRFSLPRAPADLLIVANARLDTFLVAVLASASAAGSYQLAARIAVLALLPVQATGATAAPAMARGFASLDRSAVVRRYGDATRLATIWSIPIIAGLFAFAGDITELVAPEVADAAAPLRIILVAMAIEVVTGRVSTTLLMAGRSMLTLVNAAASLGVAVALDLALVPLLGSEGAAIAWIAAAIAANALAAYELRRTERLRTPTSGWIVRSGVVTTGVVALAWSVAASPSTTTLSILLGVVAVALGAIVAARLLGDREPGAVA